jgi:ribosomal protein S18 acetylase RimI-like enzyme
VSKANFHQFSFYLENSDVLGINQNSTNTLRHNGYVVTYSDRIAGITAQQLTGFFEGWPTPPSPETHLRILKGSSEVIIAREGEEIVGFITAITDGVLCAYIPLLEVKGSHRSQGIGKELVRLMLLKLSDYYMVDLTCDSALRPFYVSQGMSALTAMSIRNRNRQSGRPE